MTACLRPTSTDNLFILPDIQTTELDHQKAVLSLARPLRSQNTSYTYERLLSSLGGQLQRVKSRHSFMPAALEPLNQPAQSGTSVERWAEYKWSIEWAKNASRLHKFIKDVSPTPPRFSFPRPARIGGGQAGLRPPNRHWSIPLRNAQMGMASTSLICDLPKKYDLPLPISV